MHQREVGYTLDERRRDGDEDDVGAPQYDAVVRHAQLTHSPQLVVAYVADVGVPLLQGAHLGRVGLHADGAEALGRGGDQEGETDVAQADHGDGRQAVLDLVGQLGEAVLGEAGFGGFGGRTAFGSNARDHGYRLQCRTPFLLPLGGLVL